MGDMMAACCQGWLRLAQAASCNCTHNRVQTPLLWGVCQPGVPLRSKPRMQAAIGFKSVASSANQAGSRCANIQSFGAPQHNLVPVLVCCRIVAVAGERL